MSSGDGACAGRVSRRRRSCDPARDRFRLWIAEIEADRVVVFAALLIRCDQRQRVRVLEVIEAHGIDGRAQMRHVRPVDLDLRRGFVLGHVRRRNHDLGLARYERRVQHAAELRANCFAPECSTGERVTDGRLTPPVVLAEVATKEP